MYAKNTTVSCEKSKAEIEKILTRYGATHFAYTTMPEGAVVQFVNNGKRIRFLVPMPNRPRQDAPAAHFSRWEKAQRQKWRALALIIKELGL